MFTENPAEMTIEERTKEVSTILAVAYLRLLTGENIKMPYEETTIALSTITDYEDVE